jgi:hypothetical protein
VELNPEYDFVDDYATETPGSRLTDSEYLLYIAM